MLKNSKTRGYFLGLQGIGGAPKAIDLWCLQLLLRPGLNQRILKICYCYVQIMINLFNHICLVHLTPRYCAQERVYRLEFVSNQDFTDSEFFKWKEDVSIFISEGM